MDRVMVELRTSTSCSRRGRAFSLRAPAHPSRQLALPTVHSRNPRESPLRPASPPAPRTSLPPRPQQAATRAEPQQTAETNPLPEANIARPTPRLAPCLFNEPSRSPIQRERRQPGQPHPISARNGRSRPIQGQLLAFSEVLPVPIASRCRLAPGQIDARRFSHLGTPELASRFRACLAKR